MCSPIALSRRRRSRLSSPSACSICPTAIVRATRAVRWHPWGLTVLPAACPPMGWCSAASTTATRSCRRCSTSGCGCSPRVSLPEHLARHAHADLFLDTTPYNAGATANDALFMGVPVLTCAGDTMASRVAGSQLNAIGLSELITTNLADYEALALTLGRDRTRLGQYRARLAANRHTAPLFDMARFTRALDDLLLAAWENRPSPPHA